MLNKRIIPKLQMRKSSLNPKKMVLVTTVSFNETIEIGDPVSQAKIYEAQNSDELIFLDLDATIENRISMINVIRHASKEIFMPFTVGGGVKSLKDFDLLLTNGADKISINTYAVLNPSLITQAAKYFGSQCVVVSLDYKKNVDGIYKVFINGGKIETDLEPITWAKECESRGAGEILITSIIKDGTSSGLDILMTKNISEAISIPVITSGGCGLAKHFIDGFLIGKADAVAAGTFFCLRDQNPMQTRSHIKNAGIPIRTIT